MFKVGDRVRRLTGLDHWSVSSVDGGNLIVKPGDEVVVRSVWDSGFTIEGQGRTGSFCFSSFELVAPYMPTREADPSGISLHAPGAKADAGKLRPSLVLGAFAPALEQVVAVGTFGAKKYSDNGWLEVPDAFNRYSDAQGRHELKRFKGELVDDDSKLLHLAHEAWNALAKLTLYLRDNQPKA